MMSMIPVAIQTRGARTFVAQDRIKFFISGEWLSSSTAKPFPVFDPGTGQLLTHVYEASPQDVDSAVQAAARAFRSGPWAAMAPNERAVYLHRLADLVENRRSEVAEIESIDVGKPLAQAEWDVQNFCQTLRYYTDLSIHTQYCKPIAVAHHEARTVHLPRGVCAFIFPWTYPSTPSIANRLQ